MAMASLLMGSGNALWAAGNYMYATLRPSQVGSALNIVLLVLSGPVGIFLAGSAGMRGMARGVVLMLSLASLLTFFLGCAASIGA